MTRMLEESVVYRAVAWLWSQLRSAVQRTAGLTQRIDAAAGRARMAAPDPADEARVREVLAGSRIVRLIDAAIDALPRAWRSSRVHAWFEPMARDFQSQPAADQIRLIAWAVIVATVTHIALVVVFGEPVGWPTWAAWGTFLLLACVPAFWSQGVVAAWVNRRPWVRRLLREPQPWQ